MPPSPVASPSVHGFGGPANNATDSGQGVVFGGALEVRPELGSWESCLYLHGRLPSHCPAPRSSPPPSQNGWWDTSFSCSVDWQAGRFSGSTRNAVCADLYGGGALAMRHALGAFQGAWSGGLGQDGRRAA